jgi:hypothetical protein
MMEAVRTSETSVDNYFTQQYIPKDNSEHHTRRRENFKSHNVRSVPRKNCKRVNVRKTFSEEFLYQEMESENKAPITVFLPKRDNVEG